MVKLIGCIISKHAAEKELHIYICIFCNAWFRELIGR